MTTQTYTLKFDHPTLGQQRVECSSIRAAKIHANKFATWDYAYPYINDERGETVVGAARVRRQGKWVWARD